MILSMLLSDMGYVVEVGQNGEEGIQLFNDHSDIALVITDIRMPKMDGNEVARHIRASHRASTPLVAITGFPEEAQVNLFDYRLVKPFKLETLRGIVARMNDPAAGCGVSIKDTHSSLERSKLPGTDPKRD